MASISCSDETGLVRTSSAPALMARTVVAVSACPVRKTMGSGELRWTRRCLQFRSAQSRKLHVEKDTSWMFGPWWIIQQLLRRRVGRHLVSRELEPALDRHPERWIVVHDIDKASQCFLPTCSCKQKPHLLAQALEATQGAAHPAVNIKGSGPPAMSRPQRNARRKLHCRANPTEALTRFLPTAPKASLYLGTMHLQTMVEKPALA